MPFHTVCTRVDLMANGVLSSLATLMAFSGCANPLQPVVRTHRLIAASTVLRSEAPFGALLAVSSGRHGLAWLA
jgi:hypothetical protein